MLFNTGNQLLLTACNWLVIVECTLIMGLTQSYESIMHFHCLFDRILIYYIKSMILK